MIGNLNQLKKNLESSLGINGGGAGAGPDKEGKKQTAGILGMAAGIGVVAGLIGGLIGGLDSVTGFLKVIGGLINQLVAPFVPILIGLMKPVFVLMQKAMGLLIKFFQDPVGNLKALFESFKGAIANILGVDPKELNGFFTAIKNIVMGFVDVFKGIFNFWKAFFQGDFKAAFMALKQIMSGLWQVLKNIFVALWEELKLILIGLWNNLPLILASIWEALKTVFVGLWELLKLLWIAEFEALKKILSLSWEVLKGIGSFIWDSLVSVFTSAFSVLKNIGKWISDKIKSFIGIGRSSSGETRVNDAIITSDGRVIRTNPQDTIIATKNPGGLGGGGVVINIQGDASEATVNLMMEKMKQQLSRRGTF